MAILIFLLQLGVCWHWPASFVRECGASGSPLSPVSYWPASFSAQACSVILLPLSTRSCFHFFALVGLKVDLCALQGWRIPLLVIAVAVAGKMIGCYIGGRLGRRTQWESLALGFGMNARGGGTTEDSRA